MTVERDWLLGAWALTSWRITLDGVDRGHPFGPAAEGMLLYGDDHMAAVLSRPDRPAFGTRLATQGTAAQREAAMASYVSYAGPWDLVDDAAGVRVVHHVRLCLFPDWVGTDLVRFAARRGDDLVLTSAPEATSAGPVVHVLEWVRTPSGA